MCMTELYRAWQLICNKRKVGGILYSPRTFDVHGHTRHIYTLTPQWVENAGGKAPDNLQRDRDTNPKILEASSSAAISKLVDGIASGPDGVFRVKSYALGDLIASEYELATFETFHPHLRRRG